jgi:hypothetical protein
MMAGRDTTTSTLTFMVYCLAMYPDVLKRLREEILEQVGATGRPTSDDIRDMKYLRAVIKGWSPLMTCTNYSKYCMSRDSKIIPSSVRHLHIF